MKSAFRKEQIIEYSNKIFNKIQSNNIDLRIITYFQELNENNTIITSTDEGYFENIPQWKPLSYAMLCDNLKKINFNNPFVEEYKNVLTNLSEIKNGLMKQDNLYINVSTNEADKLREIRLYDIYEKFKADDLMNYLEENIKSKDLKFRSYYQNSGGATALEFDKDNIKYVITIQGNQYKREAESKPNKNPIVQKWLSLSKECSKAWEKQSEYESSHMRKKDEYCGFWNNAVIYRHFNLYEYFTEVTYENILSKIKSDLNIVLH